MFKGSKGFNYPLKPTNQCIRHRPIIGFDIETYNDNKKFYCASVWNENFKHTFFNKRDVINFFKIKKCWGSIISTTNLSFDFFGTFYNQPEEEQFTILFKGSDLLYAKTGIRNKEYCKKNYRHPLLFLDTLNYARLSVESLGKLINMPKLETPKFIGNKPRNDKEKKEMIAYNMRDSEVSARALKFLYDGFYKIGASRRNTLASTSMNLYQNRFLKDVYFKAPVNVLDEQFEAYYGGRTEAFMRGTIKNYNYYDINSLYPSVMINSYPDPNSLRTTRLNELDHIYLYEGISMVKVQAPDVLYPLLPYRLPDKLIFPTGTFTAWQSHIELRKALDIGYKILKVYKTHYYRKNCEPFKEFVEELYALRRKYQKEKSPMEYVTKILMNSLYGKFGQKYRDKDNVIPFTDDFKELARYDFIEPIRGTNYMRVKNSFQNPAPFCIPIWSLYTTAMARLRLYDFMQMSHPIYCDTDSLITKKSMPESTDLGMLKKEYFIKEGIIVKPKFYAIKDKFVKIKGLGVRMDWDEFIALLEHPKKYYNKFLKFKEALRRGMLPNEIIEVHKEFSLEDTKREWMEGFNYKDFQASQPHVLGVNNLLKKPFLSGDSPRSALTISTFS